MANGEYSIGTQTRWYGWAFPQGPFLFKKCPNPKAPSIKWFNFIPTFGKGNHKSKFMHKVIDMKQAQKQAFIEYQESLGNKVMDICDTPFLSAVKVMDTGYIKD